MYGFVVMILACRTPVVEAGGSGPQERESYS